MYGAFCVREEVLIVCLFIYLFIYLFKTQHSFVPKKKKAAIMT